MKRVLILITLLMLGSEAAAKCTYDGSIKRQTLTLNNVKIPTDTSIPVGSILYSRKFGTGSYKTFTCNKLTNDQYIIDIGAAVVPGVTGIQGGPVYETGIEGIGFQVSDLLRSKNGALVAAEAGSTLVPITRSSDNNYQFITVWLVKTKTVIDTSTKSASNPSVSFSVGNMQTNPSASDRLLYEAISIAIKNINYRTTSCNISTPRSQVTLNRIDKGQLMSLARGAITPSQKTIAMNISCPNDSVGNTVTYWFNPVGGMSASGNGIVDNMLTGSDAANKVGIIFKLSNSPVVFYDTDSYNYKINTTNDLNKTINLTADYYRQSDSSSDVTMGLVKGMLEVVIQED
ncbi:fimbrial protein [Klebsiella variicola]|uniref:fimbrial protein n=1 Tax=Klebsiella variicola TaxID=244366 RepID=UPI0023F96E4D|nr:fimbrial protein [Klebsiella variicola]MDF7645430.1 fimbrial protein [Klebsiella variicola]HBZ1519946.1 fimbrial protein [Klebsiella pneumoniae]HBZ7693161.1 fimbrial protein [Klebsiella variicola subsp. variicola]HBZ7730905.1 fimbrial protein [Klebsiella variicola subsp. variicola]